MDANDVVTALRNDLVTAGIVRKPSVAAAGKHPLHIEPEAPPAPGDREAPEDDALVVATLELDVEIGGGPFTGRRRRIVVRLLYRSKHSAGIIAARALDTAIRNRLVDRPDGGLGWILDEGGAHPVLVLESTVYGGLGRIATSEDGTTDHAARYLFEVQAS